MDVQEDRDEGIGSLISRLIADGRAYADAELIYWRALLADRLGELRGLAIFAVVALLLLNAAAIGLIVGLLLILSPLVGPGLATLIVVLGALLVAGLLGWMAFARFRRAVRPRSEP